MPDDPRLPGMASAIIFEFIGRLQLLAGQGNHPARPSRQEDASRRSRCQGARRCFASISASHADGPDPSGAQQAPTPTKKVRGPDRRTSKLEGDLIEAVSVIDADGKTDSLRTKSLTARTNARSRTLAASSCGSGRIGSTRPKRQGHAQGERCTCAATKRQAGKPVRNENGGARVGHRLALRSRRAAQPQFADADSRAWVWPTRSRRSWMSVTDKNSPLKVGDVIKNIRYDIEGLERRMSTAAWAKGHRGGASGPSSPSPSSTQPSPLQKARVQGRTRQEESRKSKSRSPSIRPGRWRIAAGCSPTTSRRVKAGNPLEAIALGFIDT